MSAQSKLNELRDEALKKINDAQKLQDIENVDTEYLGRKGQITQQLRLIGTLPAEERKDFGQEVNRIKEELSDLLEVKKTTLQSSESSQKFIEEKIDVTLPGRYYTAGHPHILMDTIYKIKEVFIGLGYEMVESPEIEEYEYNFNALNYPPEHPAMDEQMSFYINDERLLRTQTTAYQHRVMKDRKLPMKVCTYGKCFRYENVDATHGHTFHQVDCIAIDKGISMADLKGTIQAFAVNMFGKEVGVRFRPDYFPFVEPGAEIAITCVICDGKGCNVCKHSGWLELGGAGLIHPNILESAGIDTEVYSGFAFGLGIDRMPMLQYGINDLRLFMENDMRFLKQL